MSIVGNLIQVEEANAQFYCIYDNFLILHHHDLVVVVVLKRELRIFESINIFWRCFAVRLDFFHQIFGQFFSYCLIAIKLSFDL